MVNKKLIKKIEINDYAVGGWSNNNGCSNSFANLKRQLNAAGISEIKLIDPVSGDEIASHTWVATPDYDDPFSLTDAEFDEECERLTAEGYTLERYDDGVAAVRYAPLADGWVVLDSWHHTTLNGVGYRVSVAIRTEDFNRIDYHNQPPHRGI